jgi:ribulose-5-phosphate 4-epimerase/fuculose-1-phosphate aldolase
MIDPLAPARQQLALANRILANEGVIDAFGHISIRHPTNPDRYLIARHRAAELVEPSDILEFTLDSEPVEPTDAQLYSEMVIHGSIYKARQEVHSVCHHHAMPLLLYCVTDVEMVPLIPLGTTMGDIVPVWDSRDEFGDTRLIVTTPAVADSLARALGNNWTVLMRRHGATVAGRTVREAVYRSIYTCLNAQLQTSAMAAGKIHPRSRGEVEQISGYAVSDRPVNRAWDYWVVRLQKAEAASSLVRACEPAQPA